CVTSTWSLAKSASSLGALAMGLAETDWELDFKQFSFHHIMQVLRVCRFSTFSLSPAFPPCYCPLAFQHQVRRLTYRISSESYPGNQGCVVSCHGAGRFANSIRAFAYEPCIAAAARTMAPTPPTSHIDDIFLNI